MESFDETAVALGISEPKRKEIKANYPSDAMMRKIRLLEVWKRSQGSDATYLALVEAFLKMDDRQTTECIVTFVKQQIHASPPDQGTEEIPGGHSQGHDEREQEQKGNNYVITTSSMGLGSSRVLPITQRFNPLPRLSPPCYSFLQGVTLVLTTLATDQPVTYGQSIALSSQ